MTNKKVTSSIKDLAEKMTKELNEMNAKSLYQKAKECVKLGVEKFYDTYSPMIYTRTEKLASFAHPELYEDDFSFSFGPQFLQGEYNSHSKNPASAEYIFLIVFTLGYHGGAYGGYNPPRYGGGIHPNPGVPYWRRPLIYSYPFWGRPAKQADQSPLQNIVQFWNDYITIEWPKTKISNLQNIIQKYNDQLSEIVNYKISVLLSIDVEK